MDQIKKEPVLISVLVGNLLALAAAFGFQLDQAQTAAIMGLVSTIVVVVFGRANVTPNVDVVAVDKGDGPTAANAAAVANGTPVRVTPIPAGWTGE